MMMMWKYIKSGSLGIAVFLTLFGCQSDYTKMVTAELEKGTREDSLLLGISFGTTREEFYGKCFDLNKSKLISQGDGNSSVRYRFIDSTFHKQPTEVQLQFYPTYDDKDVISEMTMEFSYPGWAPWNKSLQADSLQVKTKALLKNWYKGNDFVIAHIDTLNVPVKVDSNRRILIYQLNSRVVQVKVQDILHPRWKHKNV